MAHTHNPSTWGLWVYNQLELVQGSLSQRTEAVCELSFEWLVLCCLLLLGFVFYFCLFGWLVLFCFCCAGDEPPKASCLPWAGSLPLNFPTPECLLFTWPDQLVPLPVLNQSLQVVSSQMAVYSRVCCYCHIWIHCNTQSACRLLVLETVWCLLPQIS